MVYDGSLWLLGAVAVTPARHPVLPRVVYMSTDPWLRIKARIGAFILSRKIGLCEATGSHSGFHSLSMSCRKKKKMIENVYIKFIKSWYNKQEHSTLLAEMLGCSQAGESTYTKS